jgi:hypothetical protein
VGAQSAAAAIEALTAVGAGCFIGSSTLSSSAAQVLQQLRKRLVQQQQQQSRDSCWSRCSARQDTQFLDMVQLQQQH